MEMEMKTMSVQRIVKFRVAILGDTNVGKTCLARRFVDDLYDEDVAFTIADLSVTNLTLGDTTVRYEIWDTAGQERYSSLVPMYYRDAQAAVVVYDITNMASFKKANFWVKELEKHTENLPLAIVGNKADLAYFREVEMNDFDKTYEGKDVLFFETSAKFDVNVNRMFIALYNKTEAVTESRIRIERKPVTTGLLDHLNRSCCFC